MDNLTQGRERPVVSVVMLSYNHEPYVTQAIESVLSQETAFPVEILIGDDASSDHTPDIIRQYAQRYPERIVPVLREKNLGPTPNLYDLIERAGGKYIAYLECDDIWCDNTKLQQQVDFLETHPGYVACTHRINVIDGEGHMQERDFCWISTKEHYTLADFQGCILSGHGNSVVQRNFFLGSGGKYKDLITFHPIIGDRMLCMLMASMGPIYQIPQVMGLYRIPEVNRDSATATLYLTNSRATLDEYLLTYRLRKFAAVRYEIHADFFPHILELLSSAVHAFLDTPSLFSLFVVLKILVSEHDVKLFVHLIKKLIEKMKK